MFYLLDGALRILAGDQVVTVTKGDYLLVPPLMHHAWGTPMDTGADVLIVKAPGNNRFEYFRLGDRIRRGEVSPAEVLALPSSSSSGHGCSGSRTGCSARRRTCASTG